MSTEQWDDDFLNHLDKELNNLPQEKPSSKAKDHFLATIAKEEKSSGQNKVMRFNLRSWVPKLGVAAAFLVFIGVVIFFQKKQNDHLQDGLYAMNSKLDSLLQNESPTERIKAITVNYDMNNNVNEQMLNALFYVIENDESSNVRQAAVETLAFYIENENVRSTLIRALQKEEDAIVKLSIVQVIALKPDNSSKDALESIVNNKNVDPFVVNEANMQLNKFKEYY